MATLDRYLGIQVFDRNRRHVGTVSDPVSASFTDRYLALGNGQIEVDADSDVIPALLADGARVVAQVMADGGTVMPTVINAAGAQAAAQLTFMSGRVMQRTGKFTDHGTVTFQIEDDWRVLRNSLTRVVPTGNIKATSLSDLAQAWAASAPPTGTVTGASGRYQWPSTPTIYPAESAVRKLLQDELVTPWNALLGSTIFSNNSDAGQGSDVRGILPQARFGTIEDYIVPLLKAGGLSMRVAQYNLYDSPAPLLLDIFPPKTWPQLLTPESGIVNDGDWTITPPLVTDVIVGGPGDEAARAFRDVHDHGLVSQYQDWISAFRDATGAPIPWPSSLSVDLQVAMYYHLRSEIAPSDAAAFEKFLSDAGTAAMTDGQATTGLNLQLNETEVFRWGNTDGFHTGDVVTVAPSQQTQARGLRFTDRITQTTIAQSRDNGFSVTPVVGTYTDDPDQQLAAWVAQLAYLNRRRLTNQ